jgi:hypothetical protein
VKKVVVGAVLGALLVLAVGGAVFLGTQIDGGDRGQQGSSEPDEASPSPMEQQTSNDQERRTFLRDCRNEIDTEGEFDCQCLVDAVEAQVPDPTTLTVPDYAREAANESLIAGCLRGL